MMSWPDRSRSTALDVRLKNAAHATASLPSRRVIMETEGIPAFPPPLKGTAAAPWRADAPPRSRTPERADS